jgi:ABC-type amino acid transport system permease subunit
MTKTAVQAASLVLSALMALGILAGANAIATHQYVAADALAMAQDGEIKVAVQQVVVVGHRVAKA